METSGGWNVILREDSTTLSPDPAGGVVSAFDLEGRPIAWSEEHNLYKRTLASEVHGRRHEGDRRRRWIVPQDEARGLFGRLLARVGGLPAGRLGVAARERLRAILAWTPERLLEERERFERAYLPLGILPPDQYLAIVLQATVGCSWNRCSFCSFYADRPFRARDEREFEAHVAAVAALLGRGARLRRSLFLADGDALVLSNARLLPLLRAAASAFPGRPVSGFVDVFTGIAKERSAWEELARHGLERVQVGVETGDDDLLRWLGKPGSAADARAFVLTLKGAGLRVGVILLVGAGGARFAERHVARSIDLVSGLPLGPGDIIYLSPFLDRPDSAYARRARQEGVRALRPDEMDAQHRVLRDALKRARPGARVALYDIREFLY